MRKAIVFGVVALFMGSGAAMAGPGCGMDAVHSASSGAPAQTVVNDSATTATPTATKAPRG